jgi:hypothetical protein
LRPRGIRRGATERNGAQPGDPVRAADAIVTVVTAENPPLHLPWEPTLTQKAGKKFDAMRGDMEQWCELILSADFPNPILKRLKIRRTRPKAYLGIPNCCARRAGSITPIKPGPFQIGTREDRARRPCRSLAALQGLSGIGIPNRKTPARYIGPLCSIRGKSGGGRLGGEP